MIIDLIVQVTAIALLLLLTVSIVHRMIDGYLRLRDDYLEALGRNTTHLQNDNNPGGESE